MRRTTQSMRPAVSITEPLIPTIRRVGAQLSAGQASYTQRVLPTDPSAQPEFLCTTVQPRQRTDLPLAVRIEVRAVVVALAGWGRLSWLPGRSWSAGQGEDLAAVQAVPRPQ